MNVLANPVLELTLLAEALRNHARYAARGVHPADYFDPMHRAVAESVQAVWERGEPVTFDAVAIDLERSGRATLTRGVRGLAEVATHWEETLPDHVELKRLRRLRELYDGAREVARLAESGMLEHAIEKAAALDVAGFDETPTLTATDLVARTLEGLKSRAPRARLGLAGMHHAIGELPAGAVLTLGADTNVGKTSVAIEMLFAAAKDGDTVGLISVEDPDDVTGARILGMESGLSSRRIQQRILNASDVDALDRALSSLKQYGERFLYEDQTGKTELEVCAAMTRMATRGAKLIVVDYVQEIDCSRRQQDRRNEIRYVMRRLKTHAGRLGVSLVVVSQLSRPKDDSKPREPTKHSLKEAGDLENVSEVVVLLWRDQEDDFADINVKVSKCKWGGVGQRWIMRRDQATGRLREADHVAPQTVGRHLVSVSPAYARGGDQ